MKEINQLNKQKAEIEKKNMIKQLSSEKGIQLKTKIVKGPNPLSIKKKKHREVE